MEARDSSSAHSREPAMMSQWSQLETEKHQDHVIAHVVGATVLGYFQYDHAAHLLLDIGFIWKIFADGDMGLLPQSVAVDELALDPDAKTALLADIQNLHDGNVTNASSMINAAPAGCLIEQVGFFAKSEWRLILVTGELTDFAVESSTRTEAISFLPMPK